MIPAWMALVAMAVGVFYGWHAKRWAVAFLRPPRVASPRWLNYALALVWPLTIAIALFKPNNQDVP